jgi:hypothetical protein
MLIADKQNLETRMRVRMFEIRERELDYFMENLRHVAFCATLVMGFASSGFIQIRYVDQNLCGESQWMCAEFLYPLSLTLTLGFGNLTLWGCMLSTMLAPGMALHGTQGYFNKCVDWVRRAPPPGLRATPPPQPPATAPRRWRRSSSTRSSCC